MIYEIINPSDPYTIEGDLLTACIATAILGNGKYALQSADGSETMPILMFDPAGEWFETAFGAPFGALLEKTPPDVLATCFDSVLCCTLRERSAYEDALALIEDEGKRRQLREKWLDERRSSLNNIGGRAYAIAASLRTSSGGEPNE
jgi:hypothetical protein